MKSLQICLLSAVLVIAASNPIPADEPVSTATPVVPDVTPVVKTAPEQPVVPAVAVTEVPATQKSLPIDLEKIPEPQALPSKKEEPAPAKAEEKKREVPVEQPTVKPVEVAQPEQVTGKSLPGTPAKEEAIAEVVTPTVEQQPAESVKSVAVQQPVEVVPTLPAVAAAIPEAKQAVESTVVPVVPAGLASEKKIDAEAPVAIVSENVQQPAAVVDPEQKSALPVPAGQVQAAPEQPQQPQQVAQALAQSQPQERSAQDPTAVPIVAASAVEPTVAPVDVSSSGSSEKKIDSEESSSSEESKESQEEPEKKKDA
ncbi:uncharacterized protein LOC129569570 [Sitodiplosis mosellana]|uniref:uncharacterized protein LOC129569570 n=1 Tax=Sitodiplosis mosellana TaxID=263140 RepID=UPI002444E9F0|nr:uncharacterized protein LOC129569570 [Sitodiplosis mosellana]